MKKLFMLTTLIICCVYLNAQEKTTFRDSTKFYSFSINYWFNLHHYLWLESFMNAEVDSTIVNKKLSDKSQQIWDKAITYYKDNLVKEDLRSSDYMTAFKSWITTQDYKLENVPQKFQKHIDILKLVDPVYNEYFWNDHQGECKKVLQENIEIIRNTEYEFIDNITTLTRQFWQPDKLNVDITYVAKASKWNLRNRPYTTLFPTHVVMNAIGENDVKGNWLELLYHESAHHLILGSAYFVGGTINDYVETHNIKPPRELGHSYLFFFTGQLTKELLNKEGIEYDQTYMQRNGVFSHYYPYLDNYLTRYMNRELTLTEATKRIIDELKVNDK